MSHLAGVTVQDVVADTSMNQLAFGGRRRFHDDREIVRSMPFEQQCVEFLPYAAHKWAAEYFYIWIIYAVRTPLGAALQPQ